jgi:hypothetical protein
MWYVLLRSCRAKADEYTLQLPKFCVAYNNRPTVIRDVHEDINRLARSPSYRYRMTYVVQSPIAHPVTKLP